MLNQQGGMKATLVAASFLQCCGREGVGSAAPQTLYYDGQGQTGDESSRSNLRGATGAACDWLS